MSKVTLPAAVDQDKVPLIDNQIPRTDRKYHYRRALLLTLPVTLAFCVLGFYLAQSYILCQSPASMSHTPLTGWHSRATLHPARANFHPSPSTLHSGLIRSTRINPDALAVAFFAPDFVVDAQGRVLQLAQDDWEGLADLAKKATSDDLPQTGGFRNQWRIKHLRTDYPIHWLRVFYGGSGVHEVSVYGYSSETRELVNPVEGINELPDILQEAFGVLDEGRAGEGLGEGDAALADAISELISNA